MFGLPRAGPLWQGHGVNFPQTSRGSFSAVSKQASKQARSSSPSRRKEKREETQVSASQILQVNTRWKALAEIYTMHSFAPFSKLNFLFKNR